MSLVQHVLGDVLLANIQLWWIENISRVYDTTWEMAQWIVIVLLIFKKSGTKESKRFKELENAFKFHNRTKS